MVKLKELVNEDGIADAPLKRDYSVESCNYRIFGEQYLEKPYTDNISAGATLTLCTIKFVSVPDDPDWDGR
jgi:hypothetical protein